MFSNDYKYVGSVFEFDQTERKFTEPFSLKPQRTWNGKSPSPYKIIKSTKKSSAYNNVFFEGRFIFNEGYTVGIQSRSINFIIENHSSLVGDKYEYMDITPESLLYAISFNDDSCSNTVDILENKFHGLNIPLVFFDENRRFFSETIANNIQHYFAVEKQTLDLFENYIYNSDDIETIVFNNLQDIQKTMINISHFKKKYIIFKISKDFEGDKELGLFFESFSEQNEHVKMFSVLGSKHHKSIARTNIEKNID